MNKKEKEEREKELVNVVKIAAYLWWIRHKKEGDPMYQLTDFVRDKLREEDYSIKYDDRTKTIMVWNQFLGAYSINNENDFYATLKIKNIKVE